MRQGFSAPYFILSDTDGAGDAIAAEKNVLLVSDVGKNRLPTVHTFDAPREQDDPSTAALNVNLDMDIFNLFNSATVLGRDYDLASSRLQPGSGDRQPADHPLRRSGRLLIRRC